VIDVAANREPAAQAVLQTILQANAH
jgi:hypothetical protein